MARSTRVALALGSGGARGYAHIGVIGELEARGYEIVAVAGSSMGALVGGLYCAGRLDEFVEWTGGLSQLDVVRLVDVSLTKQGGMIGAERVLARVRDILGDTRIEDLPIPFTAVATDLNAGRAVWFQRGSLVDAIRASIAIPGVITPHEYQGQLLGDGGILDPLPVAPTSAVPSDVTIGVILGSDGALGGATREPKDKGLIRRNVEPLLESDFVRSVRGRLGFGIEGTGSKRKRSAKAADAGAVGEDAGALGEGTGTSGEISGVLGEDAGALGEDVDALGDTPTQLGRLEVLGRSLDIMQEALTRYQVAGYRPDVLIRIPRGSVRTLDFHKASEMIELGGVHTARALDNLPERP